MSLVILAIKGSNTEQFSKFIEHLGVTINNYNSESKTPVDQNAFCSKANQILQSGDINGLITHILTLGDVLIHEPKSAGSSFIILAMMASKIEKRDLQTKAIKDLIGFIMSRDQSQNNLKFRLLAAIFNTVSESVHRCETFKYILKLADQCNRPNILLVHLMNIDEYVTTWNLNKDEEIEIFRTALHLINKADNKQYTLILYKPDSYKERHQVYLKFLKGLDAKFDQNLFNANKSDIEAIVLTILTTFPDHVDFNNLLILKPISEVKNSNRVLYDLFEIALNGDYQEFSEWNKKNNSFLKQHSNL